MRRGPLPRGPLFPAQRVSDRVGAAARAHATTSRCSPRISCEGDGRKLKTGDLRLTEGDARRLAQYDWPGNVRELQNVIERAAILARNGRVRIDLPDGARAGADRRASDAPGSRRC